MQQYQSKICAESFLEEAKRKLTIDMINQSEQNFAKFDAAMKANQPKSRKV